MLVFALGLAVAVLPAAVAPRLWPLWLATVVIGVAALLLDALLSLPQRALAVSFTPPERLYIGAQDPLTIRFETTQPRATTLTLRAEFDALLEPPADQQVHLQTHAEVELPLIPRRRGTTTLHAIWLRWQGPLGLIARVQRVPIDLAVPITPNVRAVRAAALRLYDARSFLAGLKAQKYDGDGSEFDALREYRAGLDPRALDWKASARHRKLLVRSFRAERNHNLVLAFDTGHLMGEPIDGVPKLDRAINAGLLLAWYGLRMGDRVGVFGFDEQIRGFLKPVGNLRAVSAIQRACAELDYSPNETNFTLGLSHLGQKLRRRSLIVVLTDFVDTVTAELMLENLGRLARRHVVVFVSLRDPALDAEVAQPPTHALSMHRAVVANDLITERQTVILRLQRRGVLCIDTPPDRISAHLINRYLDIKRRELV